MIVLITADVHLGDYSDFNYNANSRLNQFDKLADRLIELGKLHSCKECWILGDLLRVPNSKSRIQHKLKKFIYKLCKNFDKVRYILGQHDLDAKSDNQDIEDTIVSITDLDNFIYMDKQILIEDNHSFAFANWTPSQDLTWIEADKVDVLLGHYTKSELFGQDIDESKFDLMIHGDIHNDQVLGKFVSVGNPIQHDYSSQSEGTCILLDTESLDWKHIKLDEDHTRFLRMYYTDNPALEGFKGELSYFKYRPKIQKEFSEDNSNSIEWDDINELIRKVVEKNNLTDIHSEISNIATGNTEVDFNIQLISFDIVGYRSIVKFHLDFNPNDRIVLLGDNGSGKSSIMNALKGVFDKSRYLAGERSDLCDQEAITVKFMYQNKMIELTKGDWFKLVIDGDEQKYNNKTEFENDLIEKFPFISYLDIFFIASGSSNLTSQLSPARCVELITKFYRLDILEEFSNLGNKRYQEEYAKLGEKRRELDQKSGSLDTIKIRLSELNEVDQTQLDELLSKLNDYSELRRKSDDFNSWKSKYDTVLARYNEVAATKAKYEARLVIDPEATKIRLNELEAEFIRLDKLLNETNERYVNYTELTKRYNEQLQKGIQLSNKIEEIKSSKCPECGQRINNDVVTELLAKYEEDIEKVRNTFDDTESKLAEYTEEEKQDKYFITFINRIKSSKKLKEDEKLLLSNKLNHYDLAKSELSSIELRLAEIQKEVDELQANKPVEVTLPMNLTDIEDSIKSKIHLIDTKNKELDRKSSVENEISEIENELTRLNQEADRYSEYCGLMSKTGEVIEEILKQLAKKFSSNEIKYDVDAGMYRGYRYVTFNIYYNVKGKWRIYNSLSSGQKQVCDLDFLNKLFSTRIGFLVLDEYLRHLDDKNFPKCIDILMSMNVNTMILSTHDPNISIYTKRILLELDENGATQSKII